MISLPSESLAQRDNSHLRTSHAVEPGAALPWRVVQREAERGVWELESEIRVASPIEGVFPFFSSAENLDALTPPWVNFRFITALPIKMREGAIIDYRIRVRGVPLRWKTLISVYEPPHRFVDEQVRGPYGLWHHTHEFAPTPDGAGTICRDRVRYALRPAIIGRSAAGRLLRNVLVGPDVQRIFEYRAVRMLELFGGEGGRGERSGLAADDVDHRDGGGNVNGSGCDGGGVGHQR